VLGSMDVSAFQRSAWRRHTSWARR
jgi:hypothetical protein